MGAKPSLIRFDKVDGSIKIHNEFSFLAFDYGWFDKICDRTKYLISEKSGITDSINHDFAKIKIDSYDSFPIEKILTFHDVVTLIKSIVNKEKNNCYYIFRKRFV